MRYCAVKNCENNDLTKGISFFHFPKDAERLETWIKFVNCPNFQVKSSSFICSALYLNNLNNIREGKLLNKKNRGGLTLPSKEFEKVVSITDSLYSEINNEKLFSQKNIITKLQCQTYKVICELHPEMFSQLENHVGAFGSHKSIVVKKIVGCYASLRAKHSCKLENQKNPKIRVQLSKLILFKNQ